MCSAADSFCSRYAKFAILRLAFVQHSFMGMRLFCRAKIVWPKMLPDAKMTELSVSTDTSQF